jgi:hypothetical protein
VTVDEPSAVGCVPREKDVERSSYGRRASCRRPEKGQQVEKCVGQRSTGSGEDWDVPPSLRISNRDEDMGVR